jgi:hypothetical protein
MRTPLLYGPYPQGVWQQADGGKISFEIANENCTALALELLRASFTGKKVKCFIKKESDDKNLIVVTLSDTNHKGGNHGTISNNTEKS